VRPRPLVDILIRGDSHYGHPEVMAWCERHRIGDIFGLAGNKMLRHRVKAEAEQAAPDRLDDAADSKLRRYAEFRYGAKTWKTERRVIARIEASGRRASRNRSPSMAASPCCMCWKATSRSTPARRAPGRFPQATRCGSMIFRDRPPSRAVVGRC
jgi:hypothetical protein